MGKLSALTMAQHLVSVVLSFLVPCIIEAQSLAPLQRTTFIERAGLRIEPGLSYTWGTSAYTFFEDYATILGGKRREFDTPISGSLRISRHVDEHQSIGLSVGFTRATLRENYDYDPLKVPLPLAPAQNITQNINLETIPVMLCYDIYPVDRQFTTYVGAAVGLAFSHLQWYEDLSSSSRLGARRRGERFNDWMYHLATELRSGVSLGFDGSARAPVRSGLRMELSYRYVPVRGAFMQQVAKSFTARPPERMAQDYTLDIGGIGIHIGIMFVLRHTDRTTTNP
ncbi:MAG: hypothetical protein RLZZ273_317 [Bacteroidota bacterium]